MFTGRDVDLIAYALSYLRASVNRDVLRDIKDACKRSSNAELAQGELKALEQRVEQLPYTLGKGQGLSERVKTYLTFHMCCTAIQVSHMDDIPKQEALERIKQMGWDFAVEGLLSCASPQFQNRPDYEHRKEVAKEVLLYRDEAINHIAHVIQSTIDSLSDKE